MSLKTRTVIIIAIPLMVFLIASSLILSHIIRKRFDAFEERRALLDADRVVGVLKSEIADISRIAADWGKWDATYAFMGGKNPDYLRNLLDDAFLNVQLNLILLLDNDGRVAAGKQFDLVRRRSVPLPREFASQIMKTAVLEKGQGGAAGVLQTADGLMLVATSPILTSEGTGPSRGMLVMGRRLNASLLGELQRTAGQAFQILPIGEGSLPAGWTEANAALGRDRHQLVQRAGDVALIVYARVDDMNGRPAFLVRLDLPREISQYGSASVRDFVVALISIGAIFMVLMILILERLVLARIDRVSRAADEIGRAALLSKRIPVQGNDELARLAESINAMLEQLERANERILRLQRNREEFTSIVSHDLRTPLTTVKDGIELVIEGGNGPIGEAPKATLLTVRRNIERMARLVANVLDFSRIESGKLRVSFENVDMRGIVSECFAFMESSVGKKGIAFRLHAPPEPVIAKCDPERIRQVLINLIDNAVKFTDEGSIDVRLAAAENGVRLEVGDTGVGIREEDLGRIFERFGQGIPVKGRVRGTGLGLTICRHIVERHGGIISVKSEVGKGTTFVIELPADPPEPSTGS